VIPEGERDSRETLVAAANAYFDAFLEKNIDLVPWAPPCNRTEGGEIRTKDGCEEGVPSGVNLVARRFIVDETIGAVVAFCTFNVGGLPDTHLFRLEKGKLRRVHTLTAVSEGMQIGGGGQRREDQSNNEN
jgi:hypothetical protein